MTLVVRHSIVTNAPADPSAIVDGPAWDANHSLTGTVDASQLNANVVQSVTNDTNITGSISAQNLTFAWSGTLAAGRLNSNVVQAITNDTNVTGSISAQNLTLGWTGQLGVSRGGTGQATATAAFNALAPTTTRGDLIARGVSSNGRLAIGTSGYALISNGTDPDWTGFLQTGTGAVTRTWNSKSADWYSVKDFGATGDGVTDDTSAITAADVAAAAAGAAVYFPGGIYKVSSAIVPSSGAHWIGSGISRTTIRNSSATANTLTVTNAYVTIEEMAFDASVTRSGGWYIDAGASQFWLRNFLMSAPFEAIRIRDGVSIINIENGTINDTVASTGNSIRIGSGTGTGPVAVGLRNVIATAAAGARPFSQLVIANAGDVTIVDCQFIEGISGIYIDPGSSQVVVSVHMIGGFSDSNGGSAVNILPTGTGTVARCSFKGAWLSQSGSSNVVISPSGTATVDGIDFTDVEIYGGTNGFAITQGAGTTVKNISITGSRIAGASAAGININGLTNGIVSNNIIGSSGGFGANSTGLTLAGTVTRISINNNDFTGSTTKITNSMTSSLSRIESNLGYNPVGNVTPTVGASPWTYTASSTRETAYVFGGTISQILINGTLLMASAASPWIIPLEPNDTMSITYTVAPSVNVQRH